MNEQWKTNVVIKTGDGSFIIVHKGNPYHVCSRDLDPINLYDVAEVATFWESLGDGDPRKKELEPIEEQEREIDA